MARRTVTSQQAIRNEIEALKAENARLVAAQSRRKAPLTRQVSEPPSAPAPVKGRKPKAAPLPASNSQLLQQLAASVTPTGKGKRPNVVEIVEARKAPAPAVPADEAVDKVEAADIVYILGAYMSELGMKRDAIGQVLGAIKADAAAAKAITNIAFAMTKGLQGR